ncbi:MAG: serine/threonine-protein kinase, partial [Cyanobacteria bacterium P01_C01_bin.38]
MSYCLNPYCQKPQNDKNALVCLSCGSKLLLKERYRAIKPIGQGGFGRTLLAVDEDKISKSACVIKQFLPQAQGINNNQKAAELFSQEVLRLNSLGKHNQIPKLLEYLAQEKYQYLVQEYIDGHNLVQILTEQGNFNEAKIYELLNAIIPVLEYIHKNGVIHRDVKPENIIRSRNGKLFLVDFGAAKVITETAILQTGTSIGTPEFVAPEQSRGKATYASDLYSLGTTCIYLLTGISPFELFDISENTWVWRQYLVDNPVSDKLSNILDKLIQYATNRRYKSAEEVLKDINSTNEISLNNHIATQTKSWQCINTLYSHTNSIDSIAMSQDGMILASGSRDFQVKLWQVSTGKQLQTLYHEKPIYAVAFSSELILACGDSQNNIHLWDINSGKKNRRLLGHKGLFTGINSLSFSPIIVATPQDFGRILASAGGDKTVRLWDIDAGLEIYTLKGHKKWVSSVAFSP